MAEYITFCLHVAELRWTSFQQSNLNVPLQDEEIRTKNFPPVGFSTERLYIRRTVFTQTLMVTRVLIVFINPVNAQAQAN
jgi:hypothetical protein